MMLWCMTLTIIGPLTNFDLLFPVMCFVLVFDQTLVGQLYRDKGLLRSITKLPTDLRNIDPSESFNSLGQLGHNVQDLSCNFGCPHF